MAEAVFKITTEQVMVADTGISSSNGRESVVYMVSNSEHVKMAACNSVSLAFQGEAAIENVSSILEQLLVLIKSESVSDKLASILTESALKSILINHLADKADEVANYLLKQVYTEWENSKSALTICRLVSCVPILLEMFV